MQKMKILAVTALLAILSLPRVGFTQDTPECAGKEVKAWVIEKATEKVKTEINSQNTKFVVKDFFSKKSNSNALENLKDVSRISMVMVEIIKGRVDDSSGYEFLSQYKNEKIIAQVLQEIDAADVSANKSLAVSLSSIRTISKDDSVKKAFCITNIDRVIKGENNPIENISYTAQITEDGMLYMEIAE